MSPWKLAVGMIRGHNFRVKHETEAICQPREIVEPPHDMPHFQQRLIVETEIT
jgi:hypothetical protein